MLFWLGFWSSGALITLLLTVLAVASESAVLVEKHGKIVLVISAIVATMLVVVLWPVFLLYFAISEFKHRKNMKIQQPIEGLSETEEDIIGEFFEQYREEMKQAEKKETEEGKVLCIKCSTAYNLSDSKCPSCGFVFHRYIGKF